MIENEADGHKEIMRKCRLIIHREIDSVYKDTILHDLRPLKRLNLAINSIAQSIGQELDLDPKTVVLMLLWDKLISEYKAQSRINEILATDPKYKKLLKEKAEQKNDLEKEEKKIRRVKREKSKVRALRKKHGEL